MSDTIDNPPPEPAPEPPVSAVPAVPGEPVVVIQYRDRFLPSVLILPLLILLLAVTAVAVIRANTPDWAGLAALRARRATAVPQATSASAQEKSTSTPSTTGPAAAAIIVVDGKRPDGNGPLALKPTASELAAGSEPGSSRSTSARLKRPTPAAGEPAVTASESPAPAEIPPPASLQARSAPVAIGFDPPGTPRRAPLPEEPAVADPEGDTRRAQDEIAREAEALHARREQLEAQKPLWLEQNAMQSEQNREEQLAVALANAEADRPRFRGELRKLLADFGNEAGPQIEALCDGYGRDLFEEVEAAGRRALDGPGARLNRADKVKALRAHGWTEQRVLIYLWKRECLNVLARNGPQSEDEALVWAARQLLVIPLTKSAPVSPRSLIPPRTRPAASRRSAHR